LPQFTFSPPLLIVQYNFPVEDYLCQMNYFELFDIPEAPVIDRQLLARKYFELQRKYHPDLYTEANEAEKEEMLKISAAINEAFGIFKDEDKTLEYYLLHSGVLSLNEKYELAPDFLMEMMELNEMAETDKAAFISEAESLSQRMKNEVGLLLDKSETTPLENIDLQKLKAYHFKKKYLNRILNKLED